MVVEDIRERLKTHAAQYGLCVTTVF